MSLTHSFFRNFFLWLGVWLLSAGLVACASFSPAELEASGNQTQSAATGALNCPSPKQTSYPGQALPSHAPIISYNLIATPLPDECVVVGPIVAIPEPKDDLPYTYREDYITAGLGFGRIFVQYQGQEIRLGDDNGSSNTEVISEKYITWTYHGFGDEMNRPLKSGLYIYEIRTGRLTRIADGWEVGRSKLDGEWMVYISWENALSSDQFPGGETPGDVRPLFAYNIASGKTITLTSGLPIGLPVILGRGLPYDISNNRSAWIEYDMQTQQYTLKVCDLNSGKIRALNLPDLTHPLSFSFSGDLAVWRDPYWHGYSLTQETLFTIPHAPPGWEGMSGIEVTARHSALEWKVGISDNENRYFRAPVIPRGQGATAWESFVIGRRPPFPTPTPAPLPTAYP